MTCRDALEFLDDYIDGKLPFGQRISFGFHLCLCRNCRSYLDSYRKTIEASRSSGTETAELPLKEMPEELVQAILASRPHGPHVD